MNASKTSHFASSIAPHEREACLSPTTVIDASHPAVCAFAREASGLTAVPTERGGDAAEVRRRAAVALFEAVRDRILYDPYCCHVSEEALRASTTLARGRAWCVPKAVLLAAAARAIGLPARLGFADVRNHLSNAKLRELMGSDVYAWHGSTSLWIDGAWVKATPAFNARLSRLFGLVPVDFDGRSDSLLHPTNAAGEQVIEYVAERGEHLDVPVAAIRDTFAARYPRLVAESQRRWREASGRASTFAPDAPQSSGES